MSLFKDIQESHDSIKALGISLLLAPFWYLSIYLFHPEWYLKTDIIIKIILSCLLPILSVIFSSIYLSDTIEGNTFGLIENTVAILYFLMMWKAILMFCVYTFCFFTDNELYYYGYIMIYFTPIIILLIIHFYKIAVKKQ
ncbi:hypothetical protein SAMN04487987_1175 [Algibacter pectinivorans]|uniref:Uncharacterized protein n=1 Tax=Algibacter pectinivorans TaxID=870482 RepID=A0A1I1S9Y3_9FLAO|nr:hypothetical protein SAMN04487987_1175 [Algibacter pectinivorans]